MLKYLHFTTKNNHQKESLKLKLFVIFFSGPQNGQTYNISKRVPGPLPVSYLCEYAGEVVPGELTPMVEGGQLLLSTRQHLHPLHNIQFHLHTLHSAQQTTPSHPAQQTTPSHPAQQTTHSHPAQHTDTCHPATGKMDIRGSRFISNLHRLW